MKDASQGTEITKATTAQQAIDPAHAARPKGIRLRAFVIGTLLIPPDAYWVAFMEEARQGPYPTTASLFANAVFILLLMILANSLLRRIAPRQALTQAELLIGYSMVCIGASLVGLDMINILFQMMAYPFRYATPSNGWGDMFMGHLPKWLMVSDPEAIRNYYEGHSSIYNTHTLRVWLGPVLWWSAFITVMLFVMMCINVLVRRQWAENERLTFPITQLPLAMTEPGGSLWKSKLLWAGFAIAGGIDLLNGFAYLYPSLPQIGVLPIDLLQYVTVKPWNAIGWTPRAFYPMIIGMGFLLPADLSFSCWFFYIFWKAQLVFSSAMAWDVTPEFPFVKEQTYGGYMVVVAMLLWSGRKHFRQVLLKTLGRPSELDDSGEAVSYRIAVLGAVLGAVILMLFFVMIGLPPLLAGAGIFLYYALAVAITRMRAELGPPVHDMHFCGPDTIITKALGTHDFDARSLTALSFFYWFNRAYRGHPMPVGIESMKMAQTTRSSQRSFFLAVMVAGVIGSLAAFWAFLSISYDLGMASRMWNKGWQAREAFTRLEGWIRSPQPPNYASNIAMLVGFLSAGFLALMRLQFVNWPFHPIGYAISGSWSMNLVWLPLMIAWGAKVSALRFGGLKFYKQVLPLFLGLIIGEVVVGSIWSLIGMAFDIPTYAFWGR